MHSEQIKENNGLVGEGHYYNSRANDLSVSEFGDFLLASGFSKRTVGNRKGAFKALVSRLPGLSNSHLNDISAIYAFTTALNDLPEWQRADARACVPLISSWYSDYCEIVRPSIGFPIVEVNPGLGTFSAGAAFAGGNLARSEVPENVRNFSECWINQPYVPPVITDAPTIVLCNLPFSAFLSTGNDDPEIAHIIETAAAASSKSDAVLFRIEWTVASRLNIEPHIYINQISKAFPKFETWHLIVSNDLFTPMRGVELFVAVSRRWVREFRSVIAMSAVSRKPRLQNLDDSESLMISDLLTGNLFPENNADRIATDYFHDPRAAIIKTDNGQRMLSPDEIARIYGLSTVGLAEEFGPLKAHQLLGDSVAAVVAYRVILGLLRAIRV